MKAVNEVKLLFQGRSANESFARVSVAAFLMPLDPTVEVGIPDIQAAMTPLFTTAPDQERAGLGFAVMQSFMDKVKVRSAKGKGTTVTLEKRLRSREENRDARRGS